MHTSQLLSPSPLEGEGLGVRGTAQPSFDEWYKNQKDWVDDYALDSPDSITDAMRESAKLALGKADLTPVLQAGVRAALEKQGITPSFVVAPTPYNARFDMSPPPQIKQVPSGSVLVVGLRPEMLCVTSALERIKGTTDPVLLHPCNLVAIDVSVVHHSADGTVDPPLVWRDTFKRATTGSSRCRSVEACTRDGMDSMLNTLRSNKLL